MHLRKLTLRGFKSFASATTLHFEPGITAVVGPNGSGKSNVVDALAWVMGEQGAKTLRGGAMADVIFAGTATRPPLGRAEVALTIDNTDGALPIAFAEVTISRTLFRGGGSEYAINSTPCRLLDIQELLSDTGMGREMHAVIGQGRLDAVLSANPEDRRGFIEEAAGVLKHRQRKDKALRKLEAMAANLQRATDLSAEIRRQLGPLARQADVARRAAVIQADVRDSRARLLADDLVQAQAQLAAGQEDEEGIATRKAEAEEETDTCRRQLAESEAAAAQLAPRLREATEAFYQLSSLRERFVALEQLAAERLRLLGTPQAARSGDEPAELDAAAAAAAQEEADLRTAAETIAKQLTEATAARAHAEEAERAAEQALATVHRGLADRREGLARLTGQVATRRSQLEAAQAELARTHAALDAARARAGQTELEFARLELEVAGAESGEVDLDAAHEKANAELAAARSAADALEEREREARSRLATATARAETLTLSLHREDATATLAAGGAPGITGTLPEKVHVEGGWDEAVAAALGPWADAALAATVGDAVGALRAARDDLGGEVRLVVVGKEGGPPTDVPDGLLAAGSAVFSDDVATLTAVRSLLARVVLVEDLAAARKVVGAHPELVAATRQGDLLSARHARGGAGSSGNVFALQAAAQEANAAVARANADLEAIRFARAPLAERLELAGGRVSETLADLHASDAALAATTERLGHLASLIRAAQDEAERNAPLIGRLAEECAGHEQELANLVARLAVASREPEDAETDLGAATSVRTAAAAEAVEARRAETEERLRLRTLEERVGAVAARVASLRAAADAEREARRRAEEREQRRGRQAAVAAQVRAQAAAAVTALATSLQQAGDVRAAAEEERETLAGAITGARLRLDELGLELAKLTDAAHRDELVRSEHRLRIGQLEERAVEELGLDPEVLVEEFGPHLAVPRLVPEGEAPVPPTPYVRAEQEVRLARAARDLERLGKVNPLALEEHAALAERHQFLTNQLADLKKSRADLLEIVREIDERVEQVFGEAFRDTAAQFEQVFSRLFPGGEGKLILTEPEDLLTSGIEIEARPAGKKVKRLSLLSGGERSLTAVALLVAIFKARPSPFYVMDEVEAALDDTNLGRLLEIFRELREDSQLIVVTHQKRTMEVADSLYGITMRDGVSTVISQRLERDAS